MINLINKFKKTGLGFSVDDEVTVDNKFVYGNYTQFVKRHRKYAPRFQYKTWEIDKKAGILTVLGIYNHVHGKHGKNVNDDNNYVVVVADQLNRVYLVGEKGIKKVSQTEELVNKIVYAIFEEKVSLEEPGKTVKELMSLLEDNK